MSFCYCVEGTFSLNLLTGTAGLIPGRFLRPSGRFGVGQISGNSLSSQRAYEQALRIQISVNSRDII